MHVRHIAILALFVGTPILAQPVVPPGRLIAPATSEPVVNPFARRSLSNGVAASPAAPATPVSPIAQGDSKISAETPPAVHKDAQTPVKQHASNTVETREEVVQGQRIGMVNDLHIYRGTGTYLFERKTTLKVVRKLAAESADPSAGSTTRNEGVPAARTSVPPPPNTLGLPSIVGRPTLATPTPLFNSSSKNFGAPSAGSTSRLGGATSGNTSGAATTTFPKGTPSTSVTRN
jgi:hypothetical protein